MSSQEYLIKINVTSVYCVLQNDEQPGNAYQSTRKKPQTQPEFQLLGQHKSTFEKHKGPNHYQKVYYTKSFLQYNIHRHPNSNNSRGTSTKPNIRRKCQRDFHHYDTADDQSSEICTQQPVPKPLMILPCKQYQCKQHKMLEYQSQENGK